MSQNLLSLSLADDQLAAIDATLSQLESQLSGLVSLQIEERRALTKMGAKSEQFCRQTLIALAQHPQIVPPSLNVAEAQADLRALDQLRPRLARLSRLAERAQDTDMALGSDVMSAALEGYALLKVSGKHQGLDTLRQSLGSRFDKSARRAEAGPAV